MKGVIQSFMQSCRVMTVCHSLLVMNAVAFGALSCVLPVSAQAEMTLEITKPYAKAPEIGLLLFSEDKTLQEIIKSDLNRSGKFSSTKNLPQDAVSSAELNYDLWTKARIPYVLVGRVVREGENYLVDYELMEVSTTNRLLGERMIIPKDRLREGAHFIADKLYKTLTGMDGDFSGRIAYVAKQKIGGRRLYSLQVADTDGAQPVTIFSSLEPILSPTWTPDGKKIAYVSFETGKSVIFLQDIAEGTRRVLASFKGINGAPSFSPDGKSLLFTGSMDGNAEIYQLNIESKQITRMTNNFAIDTEATYARDGKSFVFTSDRGGTPQIYRYQLDDNSIKRVTFVGNFNGRATLSSEARTVAFIHKAVGRKNQKFQLSTLDVKTGIVTVLSPTTNDDSPAFSPNGQMIVYATQENNRGLLAIVSVDGNFRLRLPSQQGEVLEPAWSPIRY